MLHKYNYKRSRNSAYYGNLFTKSFIYTCMYARHRSNLNNTMCPKSDLPARHRSNLNNTVCPKSDLPARHRSNLNHTVCPKSDLPARHRSNLNNTVCPLSCSNQLYVLDKAFFNLYCYVFRGQDIHLLRPWVRTLLTLPQYC